MSSQTTRGTCTRRAGDEVRAEGLGVAALGEVVDLGARRRGELVDEGVDVGPVADRLVALQPPAHPAQCRQVDLDHLLDVGALDLDHHVGEPLLGRVGRVQPRPVHLPERRSGERRLVEPCVALGQRVGELRLGEGTDRVEVLRRHLVLQTGELVGDLGRQYVEARREELAHLDHQPAHVDGERAEADGGAPVPLRAGARRPAAQADAVQEDLPEDEAEGHSAEEEHDAPVAGA